MVHIGAGVLKVQKVHCEWGNCFSHVV